ARPRSRGASRALGGARAARAGCAAGRALAPRARARVPAPRLDPRGRLDDDGPLAGGYVRGPQAPEGDRGATEAQGVGPGGRGGPQAKAGDAPEYDVVVAGGGVGGLALATRLARQGRRVAVVERTEPGTFRVGESLDWEAPVFLGRLGFDVGKWVDEGKAT